MSAHNARSVAAGPPSSYLSDTSRSNTPIQASFMRQNNNSTPTPTGKALLITTAPPPPTPFGGYRDTFNLPRYQRKLSVESLPYGNNPRRLSNGKLGFMMHD